MSNIRSKNFYKKQLEYIFTRCKNAEEAHFQKYGAVWMCLDTADLIAILKVKLKKTLYFVQRGELPEALVYLIDSINYFAFALARGELDESSDNSSEEAS